jgi:hypothetical protein
MNAGVLALRPCSAALCFAGLGVGLLARYPANPSARRAFTHETPRRRSRGMQLTAGARQVSGEDQWLRSRSATRTVFSGRNRELQLGSLHRTRLCSMRCGHDVGRVLRVPPQSNPPRTPCRSTDLRLRRLGCRRLQASTPCSVRTSFTSGRERVRRRRPGEPGNVNQSAEVPMPLLRGHMDLWRCTGGVSNCASLTAKNERIPLTRDIQRGRRHILLK